MAINYEIAQHAVAFPSKLLASNGGEHIYNIELTTDTDNGNLIGKGDWLSLDLYEEAAAPAFEGIIRDKAQNGNWYVEVTADTDALLVYQVPMIAEEYSNKFKKESNFYNKAGDIVRSYGLRKGDIFEVSEAGFDGTPVKDATVSVANKKLVVA